MKEIILNEIINNPKIRESELSKKLFCSERTIRRYIKLLKNEKKIQSCGYGINHIWIIN